MVSTLSVLTLRLAEGIGVCLTALCLGLLIAPARLPGWVAETERNPALPYAFGIGLFAIGETMVIVHRDTSNPLAAIVTILASLIVLTGLVLLLWPRPLFALGRCAAVRPRLWAAIVLVPAFILFIAGLTGRADAVS